MRQELVSARARSSNDAKVGLGAVIYAGMGAIGAAGAVAMGAPLLGESAAATAESLGAGVIVAAVTIVATRALVRRARWAQALHHDLRPAVVGMSDYGIFVLALSSGLGEELFFRALGVPLLARFAPDDAGWRGLLGVALSACAFGLLHQVRGAARWAWAAWAFAMGLVLGGVYWATGSLTGPVMAHAAVNFVNLRFLRDIVPGRASAAPSPGPSAVSAGGTRPATSSARGPADPRRARA